MTTPPPTVGHRPMDEDDLDLVRAWLRAPHVVEWWGDTTAQGDEATGALVAVLARREPDQERDEPLVTPWILLVDEEPVGWLESYEVAGFPTYAPGRPVPPGTVALDLAIGEVEAIDRGLGPRLIAGFLTAEVLPHLPPGAEVWIDPNPRNRRAVRAYESIGFVDTGVDLPDEEDPAEVRRLLVLVPG